MDYNFVRSLDESEFKKAEASISTDLSDPDKYTKSDAEDIIKIERILDVREGFLSNEAFYLSFGHCTSGHLLTMYDFVFTGLVDAGHTKSFILHTLIGSKHVINEPRRVRCACCGSFSVNRHSYHMPMYMCESIPN